MSFLFGKMEQVVDELDIEDYSVSQTSLDNVSRVKINLLSANATKWSKHNQIISRLLPTNFLSVFDRFVGLQLKGLKLSFKIFKNARPSKMQHSLQN